MASDDIAVVREGVLVLNGAVTCGEPHSERSTDAATAALAALDRLEARLRETEQERDEALRDWKMYQHEVGNMLARAVAAEARVRELETVTGYCPRCETAESRVTELEAALTKIVEYCEWVENPPRPISATSDMARAALAGKDAKTDARAPECVANWPECEDGAYDPRCCRFPKPCSCALAGKDTA